MLSEEEKEKEKPRASTICGACCVVKQEVKTANNLGDKESQEAIIAEKAFDSSVSRIKGTLSWASAGLLGTATSSTISISFGSSGWKVILANWIYVTILVLIEVLLQTVTIDAVDAPDSIGKELNATVPPKKAKRGDTVATYELAAKKEKQKKKKVDRSKKGLAQRIVRFAEKNVNRFLENIVLMATAIFANVIAIALNSAVKDTFEFIIDSDNLTTALYWIFAMSVTVITCYIALKTGKSMDDAEIAIYDFVYKTAEEHNIRKRKDIWTNEHVYKKVVAFGARRRFIVLVNYTLGLTMAWSWRDALKYTIINGYGGNPDSEAIGALWIYVLIGTLVVTFFNTLSEKYYFLYPKDKDSPLQMDTKEREFVSNAVYKNAQIVVGIAWYDALVETSDKLFDSWDNVISLWIVFVFLQLCSTLGEYYWQTLWLRFEMIEKGFVTAIYNAFDKLWDQDHILEIDEEEKKKSGKSYDFAILALRECVELTVYAWGVGAGYTVSAAVKAVLIEIYDGTFDPDTTDDISGNVLWSAWLAFFICLIISTFCMWFLSIYQNKNTKKRQKAVEKAAGATKEELENKEKEEDEKKDNNKDYKGNDENEHEKKYTIEVGASDGATSDAETEPIKKNTKIEMVHSSSSPIDEDES